MIQDLPLLDIHCHFPVKGPWFDDVTLPDKIEFDTQGSRDHGEIWRKAFNFPKAEAPLDDQAMADAWYEDMISKGLEKVVFVSGGGNERLARVIALHPDRFIGFAHNNPESPDAAKHLEKGLGELGLKGYKLLGPLIETPLDDRRFYPLWEICQHYGVPVLIHFGLLGAAGGMPEGTNISPLAISQATRDFPKLNFIVPHFGCTHMGDLLKLCWTRPNVFVDSSGSNQWIRWMPYQLTLEDVIRKFVETIGPGRLLFGTDSSWMPRGFASIYLEEQHKIFRFLGLDDEALRAVFYQNGADLLGLS